MPRSPTPTPVPAPPGAAVELSAALTATGFDLASIFVTPGNRMADPDVLAAAAAITRSRRPMMASHASELPEPVEPQAEPLENVRRRVDLLNRQFCRVSNGLATIDATLAKAIGDHLDEIGLDPK